jgi:RNA recognition motif-containing protein
LAIEHVTKLDRAPTHFGRSVAGATEHKLFVGGLAKSATSEQIAALFEKFGRVQDVYIMRGDSNEPKGPLLPPISASAEAAASWLDHAPRAVAMSARGGTGGPRFRCPGCAFVKFLSKDEALAAIAGLNEKFIMEVTRPLRAPHTRLHPRSHRLVPHAAGSKHRLQKRRRPLSQIAHS